MPKGHGFGSSVLSAGELSVSPAVVDVLSVTYPLSVGVPVSVTASGGITLTSSRMA
ncbi:MAG: hypothetical protein IJO81_05285 [Clostridia bacterium]|nr:hypothetical protein [Clostridia bacterium]